MSDVNSPVTNPNMINISIQINGVPAGYPQTIPVQVTLAEAEDDALIKNTASAAEKVLAKLHNNSYVVMVKAHKVSKKLLKKILLEAIPETTIRVVKLGAKILVLAGI